MPDERLTAIGRSGGLTGLLGLFFILMVVPGANGGIDESAKKEEEADKKDRSYHATAKSVPVSHTGTLVHNKILMHTRREGVIYIKAQHAARVNSGKCKVTSNKILTSAIYNKI